MAANDIYQLTLGLNLKGQKMANVMHFQQQSVDGTLPPNEDLAKAFEAVLISPYMDCCSNDLTSETIRTHKVSPSVGGTYVHPAPYTGAISSDTSPSNNSVIATLYSATISRAGRGRIFIPGVPDNKVSDGRLLNASAAIYVTFLDLLLANISDSGGATFRAGIWAPGASTFKPIIQHQVRAVLTTLRSRRMENP
jgi:hypothetical protein